MATYTDNYNLIKPTYSEVADVATINTNMNTIDDIMHSTQVSLAPAYDSTQTYNTDDVVMYELLMYKCTDDGVTGTWDASKWERTTASECGDSGSDVEVTQIQTEGKAVASIAVDGVSTDILVPELKVYGEASGSIAEFDDGSNKPMSKCIADINAVQDLHGYDSPWPAGGGKNLFDASNPNTVAGYIGSTAFSTENNRAKTVYIPIKPNTTYTVSKMAGERFALATSDVIPSNGATFTVRQADANMTVKTITSGENDAYLWAWVYFKDTDAVTYEEMLATVQIELGSTATAYAPYENICPISGFTEANIVVSPTTDAQDGTTYSVSWESEAGTVYGGNIDLVSGVLTVTHANIASYDGETLPSTWISDRDVYSVGGTPTTGAQVVYELATPLTYQLTPTQVISLLGNNNIWSDTGDILECVYQRDLNLVINQFDERITALEQALSGTRSLSLSKSAPTKEVKEEEETKEEAND